MNASRSSRRIKSNSVRKQAKHVAKCVSIEGKLPIVYVPKILKSIKLGRGDKLLPNSGVYYSLPYQVRDQYKAAGVIIYATHQGKKYLLLGKERKSNNDKQVWRLFGGQRQYLNDKYVYDTAYRRLIKGTLDILNPHSPQVRKALEDPQTPKLWHKPGSYVTFLVELPYNSSTPQHFAAALASQPDKIDSTLVQLSWVPLNKVLHAIQINYGFLYIQDCDGAQKICDFLIAMFKVPQMSKLLQHLADHQITQETQEIQIDLKVCNTTRPSEPAQLPTSQMLSTMPEKDLAEHIRILQQQNDMQKNLLIKQNKLLQQFQQQFNL